MPNHDELTDRALQLSAGVAGAALLGSGFLVAVAAAGAASATPAVETTCVVADTGTCLSATREKLGMLGTAGQSAAAPFNTLWGDGTAEHPNAGLFFGNGFSYDAITCADTCNGGTGGWFNCAKLWGIE